MPLTIRPYQQQTLPESGGMPRASFVPSLGIGAGLAQLGNELSEVERQYSKNRRESELNDRVGRATAELAELELTFENDTDFKSAGSRFQQAADAIRQKHLDTLDDAVVKTAFVKRFGELSLAKSLNVRKDALKREGDWNRASLDTSLELYATQAANSKNPGERALVEDQARIAIAGAQTSGWISAVDAGTRERRFRSRIDEATVLRDMSVNPSVTADKLALDPTYAANIDPVQRERWADQAYRRADSEQRRIEADAEKAKKKRGDEIMKDAWDQLQKGRLTREFVQNARPFIDPGEYHSLLRGLKEGAGQKNDPQAYAELIGLQYTNPQEAERKAYQYHKSGLIKNEVLASVIGHVRTVGRQEGPRSPYERERSYITNLLKPSDMVPDAAASARFGMAMREFDDFARQGTRTDTELRDRANDIVKRMAMVDMEEIARKTGRGYRGSPQAILEQVVTDGQALEQGFAAGRIKKPEYDRRRAELNQLRASAEAARAAGEGNRGGQ